MNAIAGDAEMEVDFVPSVIKNLTIWVEKALAIFKEAADEENKRWNASRVKTV